MAGDLNGNLLMSGGDTGSFPAGLTTATWMYAQGAWQQLPATGPSGRTEAQLVYDAQRQVWVLYGGWTSLFSVGSGNDQTWEFDGTAWSQVAPASTPGGLWKHAMCYDVLRGVTVLHATPTVFRYLLAEGEYDLSRVRAVVLGGEEATARDFALFKSAFSEPAVFINGLGPSE